MLRCGLVRRLDARPGPVPQSMLYPQCRIQFPNACSLQLCEKPGISTITIQIMKCVRGNCMRICVDEVPPSVVGVAAGPCRDSRPCCLTPPSPLRPPAESQLKPLSPLRVRHGCLWCVFRLQWCCWFQWLLFRGAQWWWGFHAGLHLWLQRCHWFQSRHVAVSCAHKSSPCLV